MARLRLLGFGISALATVLSLVGCAQHESTESDEDAIINGAAATDYPEAATIDFQKNGQFFICSGAVIAPKVVLTAGHCVVEASNWVVRAGGVTSGASSATVFDYIETKDVIDFTRHDVGLIFLNDAITLARYPTIASSPLAEGSQILNVGRILNGVDQGSLFGRPSRVSRPLFEQPFDYTSSLVIQPGDSGGPDFAFGTHTIVSVNSGEERGGTTEFLARVDLVKDFIQQQIDAHGGGGAPPAQQGGVIPDQTLRTIDRYDVVAQQLNCRSGAGTANPVEQQIFQGQVVQATEVFFRPRVAVAPDGAPWLLVQPPSGGACYVSANFSFIAPQETRSNIPAGALVQPGLYGPLAVAVHGNVVTGSVRDSGCEFTIAGQLGSSSAFNVRLLTPGSSGSGRVTMVDDSTLRFSTSSLPGSCSGVFDTFQIGSGVDLALRANIASTVFAFRTVSANRAFFHDGPASPAKTSFVVRGQTVRQLGPNDGGFAKVMFTSDQGAATTGFLAEADLVSLGIPGAGL